MNGSYFCNENLFEIDLEISACKPREFVFFVSTENARPWGVVGGGGMKVRSHPLILCERFKTFQGFFLQLFPGFNV